MDRELEKQLEELQKNFAGLAKTLGSSSRTILKNHKEQKTFGNLQKVTNKSLDDYQKKNKKNILYLINLVNFIKLEWIWKV